MNEIVRIVNNTEDMKIKLTFKYIIAFMAFTFLLGELHELVHTSIGRTMCGCWGDRDFNGWGLCDGCWDNLFPYSTITTFAGPLFTFIMGWIGYFLLGKNKTINQKALGFALVFGNMPFARLLTAAGGGGDEVYALSLLTENFNLSWIVGFVGIFLITFPPLKRAYQEIGNKRKIGWFLLFFLTPTAIYLLVVLIGLNGLLSAGVLSGQGILGSPVIINIWTVLIIVVLFFTRNHLYNLFISSSINSEEESQSVTSNH